MGYILNLETKHGSYCLSCLYWSNTNTGVDVDLPTSTDGCSKALVKHGKGGHLLFWYVRGFFFGQRIFQVLQINIFGYQLILCPLKKKKEKRKKEFHIELAVLLKGLIQHFCSVSQTSTASENCVAVQKKIWTAVCYSGAGLHCADCRDGRLWYDCVTSVLLPALNYELLFCPGETHAHKNGIHKLQLKTFKQLNGHVQYLSAANQLIKSRAEIADTCSV